MTPHGSQGRWVQEPHLRHIAVQLFDKHDVASKTFRSPGLVVCVYLVDQDPALTTHDQALSWVVVREAAGQTSFEHFRNSLVLIQNILYNRELLKAWHHCLIYGIHGPTSRCVALNYTRDYGP